MDASLGILCCFNRDTCSLDSNFGIPQKFLENYFFAENRLVS